MIPVHRICKTCRVIWRCRFIIHLMHALSFGDAASSYIFRMPPDSAIPVHRTPFFSASLGDSGASYIVNTPPYLAMPIQKLTETCHHPPPPSNLAISVHLFILHLPRLAILLHHMS